ncbi:hypothetical protein AQUCO_00900445v1 [Aquilegia coerulea]|uniref:Uncharacterized protein n=1 Tax=Aquilegia coerulea TaxID=218851 RepID=A0A2G5EDP3_AQUCA|nr:hypothetical protein AQUCO_00900445v1 [Aquilegia coerulea]
MLLFISFGEWFSNRLIVEFEIAIQGQMKVIVLRLAKLFATKTTTISIHEARQSLLVRGLFPMLEDPRAIPFEPTECYK